MTAQTTYDELLQTNLKNPTAIIFLQIVFIIALCRILGRILAYLKQPPVVGEILAGIIIGPSVLGQSKAFTNFLFNTQELVALKGISDIGVVFFMFILGLEFNPMEILKSLRKTWLLGLCGVALPFGLGCAVSQYLYDETETEQTLPNVTFGAFVLFAASTMSFTAFPVLARILTANNALTAQIGLVSMGISAIDDMLAWTVLAIATSYQTGGSPQNGAWGILIGIAWTIFLLTAVRGVLLFLHGRIRENLFIVLVFMGMCISAWVTQVLGLHAFFGGFIFGVSVPKEDKQWISRFIDQLEVIVVNFFVPIFFANSGLSTDLTTLASAAGPVLVVFACAAGGKMLPPLLLGRFYRKYTWRFSFQLASLMNARGLVQLIALSVAKDAGAFNTKMYSVYIVMALVTTFMSGPMFYFSYDPKKDPPTSDRELKAMAANAEDVPLKSPTDEEAPKEQIPPPSAETGSCSEIPKEDQLPPDIVRQFSSSYLFHGTMYKKSPGAPRPSLVGKTWDPNAPRDSVVPIASVTQVSEGNEAAPTFKIADSISEEQPHPSAPEGSGVAFKIANSISEAQPPQPSPPEQQEPQHTPADTISS